MPIPGNVPSVDDIRQLPAHLSMAVPPEWEDRNGHVNVQYYQTLYELGGWQILEGIEINERYLAARHAGIFDLEHHTHYLTEIHVGETVSVHNRMLGRNDKLFHGIFFIVNDTNQQLACTIEYLSIYVNLQVRHTELFPKDMALRLDKLLHDHNALNWQAPVCGLMNP